MLRTIAFAATIVLAAAGARAAPQKRDEASVRAVETGWSEAFITGDAAYLNALLDSSYVSVGATGKAHPKAEIVSMAQAYAAKNPGKHADPLPATSTIQLIGATALVRHHSVRDTSIDLFRFDKGRWRAVYSQHTAIAPAA